MLQAWGALNQCNTSDGLHAWSTPHDGGDRLFECMTYHGCLDEKGDAVRPGHVAMCLWDGYHGDWPADGLISKVTFWWFRKHVLNLDLDDQDDDGIDDEDTDDADGDAQLQLQSSGRGEEDQCETRRALAQH